MACLHLGYLAKNRHTLYVGWPCLIPWLSKPADVQWCLRYSAWSFFLLQSKSYALSNHRVLLLSREWMVFIFLCSRLLWARLLEGWRAPRKFGAVIKVLHASLNNVRRITITGSDSWEYSWYTKLLPKTFYIQECLLFFNVEYAVRPMNATVAFSIQVNWKPGLKNRLEALVSLFWEYSLSQSSTKSKNYHESNKYEFYCKTILNSVIGPCVHALSYH